MAHLPRPLASLAVICCAIPSAFALPAAAQSTADSGPIPRFEEAPCTMQAPPTVIEQFRCGSLVVAEDRSVTGGRTLRLAVAVLRSTSAAPAADPLVFISGGPGSASVDRSAGAVRSAFRGAREMVFFDQRGTGRSDPRVCDRLNAEWERITWLSGLDAEGRRREQLAALDRCREEIDREGVDLSQYNTVATVHDLEDLRTVLGYESWNLWGLSYGSRVALEYLRVAPSAIRSVILDGPLPPNAPRWSDGPASFAEALGRLMERCAQDASCAAAFPDGEAAIWRTVEALERDPMRVATGGQGGLPDTLVVDGTAFAGGVLNALYSSRRSTMIPLLAAELSKRNEAFVMRIAPELRRNPERLQQWMNLTVVCADVFPFRDAAAGITASAPVKEIMSRIGLERDAATCEHWHPHRADAAVGAAVVTDIPALIITGEFDPATHRSYGPLTAATLSRSQLVEIPGAGHVEAVSFPCTQAMMVAFLAEPTAPVNRACLSEIPPPTFMTGPPPG